MVTTAGSWSTAPLPRRWHRCRPDTEGFVYGLFIERCACGALRVNGSYWMWKNDRRKS